MTQVPPSEVLAFLRAHRTGEIQFDEHLRPLKTVIAPDGRLVAPVMVAMMGAADTVLFLPHADEDALQIQISIDPFKDEGAEGRLADRWRIYHGEPEDVNWAFLYIDAAKFKGTVVDGDALMVENPLAADEARLCREVNTNGRPDLIALCQRRLNLDLEEATLVGVDPAGVDIRGPFTVQRIEFPEEARDAAHASAMLREMLEES